MMNTALALAVAGMTDYDDGTGFWLGHDGSTPKFSIGNSGGSKLTWDGSNLTLVGNLVVPSSEVKSFTPTWTVGFSSAPTGDIHYIDFGSFVMMWTGASRYGTSNAASMELTGVPAGARPSDDVRHAICTVYDGATVGVDLGLCIVHDTGGLVFYRYNNAWSASGSKGLPAGWFITYPK